LQKEEKGMGKKKLIPVLAASVTASSAFVIPNNSYAASQTQIEVLVNVATKLANDLKKFYSSGEITLQQDFLNTYEKTKKAIKNAQNALNGYKGSNKRKLENQLEFADQHRLRAARLIDAIKVGNKLKEKSNELQQFILKQELNDETVETYHELSKELKMAEQVISKVYGTNIRKHLLTTFVTPAKITKETIKYEVSIYLLQEKINDLLSSGKKEKAKEEFKILERLSKRAAEIKEAGNKLYPDKYPKLEKIEEQLKKISENLQNQLNQVPNEPQSSNPSPVPSPTPTPNPTPDPTPSNDVPQTINKEGTYGPKSGEQLLIQGNVTINSPNVTLQNVKITGDLILGEGIGEGEVTLNNVNVSGTTYVKGGGVNSIHFNDSVLATVIVNKNDGKVRIVASGNTRVIEVQLESPAKIEENNLTNGSEGFTDLTVSEALQTTNPELQIDLIGTFETVNSRATNVRINLSETTDIQTLILNVATHVLGNGNIRLAQINADGSTISSRPQNLVLMIPGISVQVGEQEVTESYSETERATLKDVDLTPYSLSLQFDSNITGLTEEDFEITATLGGEPIELKDLEFNSTYNMFTFTPVSLQNNIGKELVVKVTPKGDKVTGESITKSINIDTGFGGRITDIYGVGVEGLTIKFRQGFGNKDGQIVKEAVTDKNGYYWINLPEGEYTGELSKQGYITSYILASAPSDVFNINQNETAIRAAASNELKIMLTWNENPRDIDSHLFGPTKDGNGMFHTWYAEKVYSDGQTEIVDLDWDDVDSFGPETTTIRKLTDGTYRFYVHNYSGDAPLRTSGAKVQVFKGNSLTPDYTFDIPAGEGNEVYWYVFEMKISNNGQKIEIEPKNELYEEVPTEFIFKSLQALISEANTLLADAGVGTEPGQFPQSSVDTLRSVLTKVESLNENSSRDEIDKAIQELSEAINEFLDSQIVDERANLLTLVQEAHHLLNDTSVGDQIGHVSGEARDTFNQAIIDAETILSDSSKTQEEFRQARETLESAIQEFLESIIHYNPIVLNFTPGQTNPENTLRESAPQQGTEPEDAFPGVTPYQIFVNKEQGDNGITFEGELKLVSGLENENIQLWYQTESGEWFDLQRDGLTVHVGDVIDIYPVGISGEHPITLKLIDENGDFSGEENLIVSEIESSIEIGVDHGEENDGVLETLSYFNVNRDNQTIEMHFNYPLFTNPGRQGGLTLDDFEITYTDGENDGSISNVSLESITSTTGEVLQGGEMKVLIKYNCEGTPDEDDILHLTVKNNEIFDENDNVIKWTVNFHFPVIPSNQ
jgi:predicted peroxiredoxin